jgi:hypothetical protein
MLALSQLDLTEGFNRDANAKLVTKFLLNNQALVHTFRFRFHSLFSVYNIILVMQPQGAYGH